MNIQSPKEEVIEVPKLSEVAMNSVKNTEAVRNTSFWTTVGKTANQCLRPITWVKEKIKPVMKDYVVRPVCNQAVKWTPHAVDGASYLIGNTGIFLYNIYTYHSCH